MLQSQGNNHIMNDNVKNHRQMIWSVPKDRGGNDINKLSMINTSDQINFHRYDSRDSKQEVGGPNSAVNISNFTKDLSESKHPSTRFTQNDTISDIEQMDNSETKLEHINKHKLAELKVSCC